VVKDVEDGGDLPERGAQSEQQCDETQMADGRVSQQALDIVLEQREVGAQQQGREAHAADAVKPQLGARQYREEPAEQEDAGLDHSRRVQIGAHRGWSRHGVRQPEVERKLCRFGRHAEQEEYQNDGIKPVVLDRLTAVEHDGEFVAADHLAHQDHCGQQREAAGAGDE